MTGGPAAGPRRRAIVALAATLAIQVYTSIAATATSVLAPEMAPSFGVSPGLVGVFVGLIYAGSMTGSLASGTFIARHGAIRVSQVCVLLCAAGLGLLPWAAGSGPGLALLALAPLVIGAGYGPITPASSQVLARTAPPRRRALTFSIKQTGVPAGAAIAGAALPTVALALGWRGALVGIAVLGVVVALAAQAVRRDLDADAQGRAERISLAGTLAPLRQVFAHPVLAELAMVSFFYAATQVSLLSFLVVYVHETLGRSLVAAGLALTAATAGGIVGRILWGAVADRALAPRGLLAALGLGAGACAFATAAFPADVAAAVLLPVCAVFGATAIGWNGVQLAELARHAPAGAAGAITGAAGFVTFAGVVCGPPLFALLAATTGSYRTGFAAVGVASAGCGLWLLLRRQRPPAAESGSHPGPES